MPQQYVASDSTTGLQVQVTGEFPEDPDDRVRIARTTNLFTRLMATVLSTTNDTERRERFRAIETQLEVADALIRGDLAEVQRLIRETLHAMGISDDQLREVEQQLREQLRTIGGDGLAGMLGLDQLDLDEHPDPDSSEDPDRPGPDGQN
jgi:endonuclease III